ncbi:MAG: shikimate kinase [Lachnospiraceae bacterium]
MKKNGKVVLLTATPETILKKGTGNNHDRPLLEGRKNEETYISELMEKRRAKYEAAADIQVATDNRNKQQICDEMVKKLRESEKL